MLPSSRTDGELKVNIAISAFLSAMERFHGREKIVFANIAPSGWPDPILREGLKQIHLLVRFAPTPTNTLHLGNVRTALISYLLHRSQWKTSRFFLRIDDTNKITQTDDYTSLIKQDLQWLGLLLTPEFEFKQSDPSRQHIYAAFLSLLGTFGYTRRLPNREIWLDWENPDLQFVHWFDWKDGPIIEHVVPRIVPNRLKKSKRSYPPADPTGRGIANLALTNTNGEFLYKFCGTVDDLLCTSHAVRDVRQVHLSRRQSVIRHAIQLAWHEAVKRGAAQEERQVILAERERLIAGPSAARPIELPARLLPFLSPPVFVHTPVVADSTGEPLRKRDPHHKNYLMLEARNGVFLPETIVSYLLSTIVHDGEKSQQINLRHEFAALAGEVGAAPFLDAIATQFSTDWLNRKNDKLSIALDDLRQQERLVLSSLSYFHLRRHLQSFCQSIFNVELSEDFMERIYLTRRYFDSWGQIVAAARKPEGGISCEHWEADALVSAAKATDAHLRVVPQKTFNAALAQYLPAHVAFAELCSRVRNSMIGINVGPPLAVLIYVLGLEESEKRLRSMYRGALTGRAS